MIHSKTFIFGCSVEDVSRAFLGFLWAVESLNSIHVENVIFESPYVLGREALKSPHQFPMFHNLIGNTPHLLLSSGLWSVEQIGVGCNCNERYS